jgi:hypothetical protein
MVVASLLDDSRATWPEPEETSNAATRTMIRQLFSFVSLGETTFAQVSQRLGAAPIVHTGDAGESRYQACYVSADAHPATYYLESDEMGSGTRVTQFEAIAAGGATAAEEGLLGHDCRRLTGTPAVRTDRGVALGLARAEVEQRMGGSGRDSSGVTIYDGSEDRRGRTARTTAWSSLRLRYVGGRLVAFSAAAGITN